MWNNLKFIKVFPLLSGMFFSQEIYNILTIFKMLLIHRNLMKIRKDEQYINLSSVVKLIKNVRNIVCETEKQLLIANSKQ